MKRLGFFSRKTRTSFSAQKISGLIVPLITPLNEDFSVDLISLKNLVARLMNKGVQNFFVFSRFSEYESISEKERIKVLQTVCNEVSGKGCVLAGCFSSDSEKIVDLVKESSRFADFCAVNFTADALDSELKFADFFEALMANTSTKIVLYNNPSFFGGSIPIEWLNKFINWENLCGIIDASRNPDYFDELSKLSSSTKLFEENEEFIFDSLRRNFSGLGCVSSLLFPSYYLQLIENFEELDFRKMMRNEAKISALNKLILPSKRIQAVKHVLFMQGIIQPHFFNNLESLNEKEKKLVEDAFRMQTKVPAENNVRKV